MVNSFQKYELVSPNALKKNRQSAEEETETSGAFPFATSPRKDWKHITHLAKSDRYDMFAFETLADAKNFGKSIYLCFLQNICLYMSSLSSIPCVGEQRLKSG